MNTLSLSIAAAVLLVGIAKASRPDPNVYYTTQSSVYVTHSYTHWKNSRDACYQVGMEPLALSSENIFAAFKALRESNHKHGWVERVRSNGGWYGSYLSIQLSTDAGHMNERELRLGELGEVVEETNHDVTHVTLCERPGSHSRYGASPRPYDRHEGANRRSFDLNRGQHGPYRYDNRREGANRRSFDLNRGQYGPYRYDDRRRYDDGRYNDRRYDDGRYNDGGYNDRRYNDGGYNDRRYNDGRYNDGGYNDRRYDDGGYNDRRYDDGRYNDRRYDDGRYNDRRYDDGRYNDRRYDDGRYSDRRYDDGRYRDNTALRRVSNRWVDPASESEDRDYNRYRNRYNFSSDNYRSYDPKLPPRYNSDRRYNAGYDTRYNDPYYGGRYSRRDRSRHVEKGAEGNSDRRGGGCPAGYGKGSQQKLRAALENPANKKYKSLPDN